MRQIAFYHIQIIFYQIPESQTWQYRGLQVFFLIFKFNLNAFRIVSFQFIFVLILLNDLVLAFPYPEIALMDGKSINAYKY